MCVNLCRSHSNQMVTGKDLPLEFANHQEDSERKSEKTNS